MDHPARVGVRGVGADPPGAGTERPGVIRLVAGTVAFNEERRIADALRSLLSQSLPDGCRWEQVLVVASGCTDRTAERAREVDPRVEVVVQVDRLGKASALLEIFARAKGDYLVLLNGDALAEPGSVASLVRAASRAPLPFAVMARPGPPPDRTGGFTESIRLLWEIHHRFHEFIVAEGSSSNLSDELLLLPIARLPPLPAGVVNDGGFIGAWLRRERGTIIYASEARVTIEAARRFRDHVSQRRRIRWGLHQVESVVGVPPMTLQRYSLTHPVAAMGLLRDTIRSTPRGLRSLLVLATAEMVALGLALWDRAFGRRDHVLWATLPE
ncbi:MAG: glycosyltransferase [Thermoplasmata archaeon]|nr:glycosyltransferase [Thermoplasmata archaeon]